MGKNILDIEDDDDDDETKACRPKKQKLNEKESPKILGDQSSVSRSFLGIFLKNNRQMRTSQRKKKQKKMAKAILWMMMMMKMNLRKNNLKVFFCIIFRF